MISPGPRHFYKPSSLPFPVSHGTGYTEDLAPAQHPVAPAETMAEDTGAKEEMGLQSQSSFKEHLLSKHSLCFRAWACVLSHTLLLQGSGCTEEVEARSGG